MTTPVVLDEDTYTEALSSIIERDFFPHLAKVKAQQNYLQAQQTGTLQDLERASKALHRLQTPSNRSSATPIKGIILFLCVFFKCCYICCFSLLETKKKVLNILRTFL